MKSKCFSPLLVGLVLLLLSFTIGCGQSQSEIPQEGSKAGLAQSGAETTPPPSTTPTPDTTPTPAPRDESKVHFEQGNIYLEQEEWYDAIYEYTQAIELNPEFAEAYANRGAALLGRLKYDLSAGNESNYNHAIADCEKAIELNPLVKLKVTLAEAYVQRGYYYFSREKYDEAIADYTKAIELDPLVIECQRLLDIYWRVGLDHLEDHDYDKAIIYYTKAIELDCGDSEYFHRQLAEAYYGRGMNHYEYSTDREKAIADYTRAIELDPTNANYYLSRAGVYDEWAYYYYDHGRSSEQRDSNNKAIADYTKVIELKPEVANFYYFRGRCYADNGDYTRAIADYSRAIELGELGDLIANVYWGRASAHENLGNNEKALTDYRKALELSEDDWTKEQILKDIEKLEAKYVIKDLAYIKASTWSYSDDADPEYEGVRILVSYYNSKSETIIPKDVSVEVTLELYWYTNFPHIYKEKVTIDYTGALTELTKEVIRIPFEGIQERPSGCTRGPILILTVNTPNQGNFEVQDTIPGFFWP